VVVTVDAAAVVMLPVGVETAGSVVLRDVLGLGVEPVLRVTVL